MRSAVSFLQHVWLAPFAGLGLMALALARPYPVFPIPTHHRLVKDANGVEVAVPLPLRAVVTTGGGDFLELTHASEALYKAASGGEAAAQLFAASLHGHIYSDLAKKDELWNLPRDIESILNEDDGETYISGLGNDALRRIGLPVVALSGKRGVDVVVRTAAAVLGREPYGETLLANQGRRYADIEAELHPETLTHWPRVVPMGSSPHDWSNVWTAGRNWLVSDYLAGVENASEGFSAMGRYQEAERILAMNPDIIFYSGNKVEDLLNDPRWHGLKAVKDRKVYIGARNFRGAVQPSWNFDIAPLIECWEAEIAHPERMQPKLRELARAHFLKAYGYRLSDDEIDDLLRIAENKGAAGYARFIRDDRVDREDHAQQ